MSFQHDAAAFLAGTMLDGLFRTLEYRVQGAEQYQQFTRQGKPVIFAIWHGRLLPPAWLHRNEGVVTLISRSADGEYLARFLAHWGFRCVRGSSSRGGREALRELVRSARSGASLAITPDGPRGPMQKVKPGVLVAAQLAGVPIIPAAAAATRGWWPGSWDRFLVPKPFARVEVSYGEPFHVPRHASGSEIAGRALELEATLNALTAGLDARVQA